MFSSKQGAEWEKEKKRVHGPLCDGRSHGPR
jgi:hypothetical protein